VQRSVFVMEDLLINAKEERTEKKVVDKELIAKEP
jgi:hypothetical protein